jgi:hypothetical protein
MQHLVIRSTLEWVLHSAERTVVVVPEAWKFIPQGRGTPVKLAAEAYIRQAAALKNYLWLDSQDIAGVEKIILKSCPVWILGVQREANEIQRTLDQIPGAKKRIHAEDVARLGLGQFYVCHGDQITKAYAQPRWLEDRDAQAIARGQLDVHSARLTDLAFQLQPPVAVTLAEESTVTEQEAAELREENTRLQDEARDLRARIEVLELRGRLEPRPNDGGTVTPKIRLPAERETVVHDLRAVAPLDPALGGEELYEQIKARLSAEAPQILKVLATRPELDVTVQRVTVELDGATPQGRIARLIADGFFAEPRAPGQVQAELARRGKDPGPRIVDGIRSLSEMGFFLVGSGRDSKSRVTTTYQAAPGIKVRTREIAA